jgi:hypothetical protein
MKKSELKEMIQSAILAEASEFETNKPERVESFLKELDDLVEEYHAELYLSDEVFAGVEAIKIAAMAESTSIEEAKDVEVEEEEDIDVEVEDDVVIDDEETDIEIETSMPGESESEQEVQGLLMKAQEEAAKLGDEKLTDQIGNTITYFTRAHISQVDEGEDVADINISDDEVAAEEGFELEENKKSKNKSKLTEEVKRFKKLAGIIK